MKVLNIDSIGTQEYYDKLRTLNNKMGVYLLMCDEGEVLYIGKSTNLKQRIKSHKSNNGEYVGNCKKHFSRISVFITEDSLKMESTETHLLQTYSTKYNKNIPKKEPSLSDIYHRLCWLEQHYKDCFFSVVRMKEDAVELNNRFNELRDLHHSNWRQYSEIIKKDIDLFKKVNYRYV